jgi:hypothetical protein
MQIRCVGGEHGDALVQVGVPGRAAERVVDGQLDDPGTVQQPAQHQNRLPIAAQRPGFGPGPEASPLSVQETGQEQHGLLAYGQGGGVCDTHDAQDPY